MQGRSPNVTRVVSPRGTIVNDVHSQLNATCVAEIVQPRTVGEIRRSLCSARAAGRAVAVAGGRHSMGGQQFTTGGTLIDMSQMNRVLDLDTARGVVDVEAGVQWPQLIQELHARQAGNADAWSIRQKQTGADRFSIGGSLASNVHGRGLTLPPLVGDIEEFTLLTPDGELWTCSRRDNTDLFRLVIGGYGLLGIVTGIRLRLGRRVKLQRVVEIIDLEQLPGAFADRIADGFSYGDFQFAIDPDSSDFLRRGVFSCYRPVDHDTVLPLAQAELGRQAWRELLLLAHTRKTVAFDRYAEYYRRTDGQIYWSDLHQFSVYIDDYHREIDVRTQSSCRGSEMITELYVPRSRLVDLLLAAACVLRAGAADCVYGTVRLVEQDDETFLPWARTQAACVVFNLHVGHTPAGVRQSATVFRALIDCAMELGGSYYLTYHRFARRDQVLRCYPEFPEFIRLKRRYDPGELLRSDWYSQHVRLLEHGV